MDNNTTKPNDPPFCKYNLGVDCSRHDKCDRCGWNPEFVKSWWEKRNGGDSDV